VIALVYAVSLNGVIGKDGGLPWNIPSDLAHFKAITMGKPIIMGRKTWESLPRKPLPGRRNIIVSRQPGFHAEGAETFTSIDAALDRAADAPEICVIGGAELFNATLPKARRIYLTRVLAKVEGDTFMAELSPTQWHETARNAPHKTDKDSASFETITYDRHQ